MKDYKRLTERDEFRNADIIGLDTGIISENLSFEELGLLTKALNRLAYFEDRLESGELVDINKLMRAKTTGDLTDKEIEFFIKHNEKVRKETAREILRMIKDKGLFRYGGYLLHDSDFDTVGKLYGLELRDEE